MDTYHPAEGRGLLIVFASTPAGPNVVLCIIRYSRLLSLVIAVFMFI